MAEAVPGPRGARLIVGLVMASLAGVYVLAAPSRTDGAAQVVAAAVPAFPLVAATMAGVGPMPGCWAWGRRPS